MKKVAITVIGLSLFSLTPGIIFIPNTETPQSYACHSENGNHGIGSRGSGHSESGKNGNHGIGSKGRGHGAENGKGHTGSKGRSHGAENGKGHESDNPDEGGTL